MCDRWPGLITLVAMGILAGMIEKERLVMSRRIGNYAGPASKTTLEGMTSNLPCVGSGLLTSRRNLGGSPRP